MGIEILLFLVIGMLVCSIPFIIIESNHVRLFSIRWYKIGIAVYRNSLNVPSIQTDLLTKDVYAKDEGVYHFAEDGVIYFRSIRSQGTFVVQHPFPFKCTAHFLTTDTLEITARIPLGPTIFFACFFLIGVLLTPLPNLPGIPFLFFTVLIFLLSYRAERKRLLKMKLELKRLLGTGGR